MLNCTGNTEGNIQIATWNLDHQRNLRYFFIAAQETAQLLTAAGRPGSIVGVTSIDGIQSAPYHGAYGAAKAGLVNLVRTMAVEGCPTMWPMPRYSCSRLSLRM